MATAGDIVRGALKFIQYQSASEPVTAEDMSDGIEALNDMMASWSDEGIRLGYREVDSSGDYITAPQTAFRAMKQNLGLELSPMFRASDSPVNPALATLARQSKRSLKNKTIKIGDAPFPTTMPRGSGNDWYGDYRSDFYEVDGGLVQMQFSANASAESLTANTPAVISGPTWTVLGSVGFTASTSGNAVYKSNGITEVQVRSQLLIRGSGSGYPGEVTVYVARNNEYIESSSVTVAIDDNTSAGEKLVDIDFGPLGITKADTVQLMIKSTTTAVLVVSGYLEIAQCE